MTGTRATTFVLCMALAGGLGCGSSDPTESQDRSSGAQSSATSPSGTGTTSGSTSGTDFGNSSADPGSNVTTVTPTAGLDEDTCARADVVVERIKPRIVFLVDASSSMGEDFGGVSRWDALREALLASDGLVTTLQEIVKFGLVAFEGPRYTTCPAYRYAAPAAGNFELVDAAFPGAPPTESSTPTGAAMDWAIDNAFLDQVPSPDVRWEPQYLILATDGEPNGCAQGSADNPPRDFDSVLAAATKAATRGIEVFVISLAEPTGEFATHLAEVASIGMTDTVFSPQSKADLVSELETIIGSAVSCQVELTAGRVREGTECKGEVTLDGEPLECNGADGWELADESHLLLKGTACDAYKLAPAAVVNATFPCEALR